MALMMRMINVGKLNGTVYTLEDIGDQLPVHVHETEDMNHVTILMFGTIKLLGAREGTIVEAQRGGVIINWPLGEPHGIEAVTPGATFFNLIK
jgi:hypothetical protein